MPNHIQSSSIQQQTPFNCIQLLPHHLMFNPALSMETSGVMSVPQGIWTGLIRQVNFMDDEIGTKEFACVDLSQDDLEYLWSQLPDVVEISPELLEAVATEPHLL